MHKHNCILSINGGSSGIKFSLFKIIDPLELLLSGEIEKIGSTQAKLHYSNEVTQKTGVVNIPDADHNQAAEHLISWLETQDSFGSVTAIGHRVVHGMKHTEPELITNNLVIELKSISAFDPEHLPGEIKLIELFRKRFPAIEQVACFDTSFHTSMPRVAKLLSIPRRYFEMGIQRYGFHGLSYAYLLEELAHIAGKETVSQKIILAHLGNGASLAAVKDGKSVDTSMGFTPASGLPMGTRSGDLDPGAAWYLMYNEKLNLEQFNNMINYESGLLGISGTSSDMRELINKEYTNTTAREAIEFFCYQTKKWIGSFAAVLNGVENLVFSGGIGEHVPEIRSRICDSLAFLGIELDEIKNMNNETIISTDGSKVKVYVIKTNEALMIAKLVRTILKL
ncbi:MAG: acetate/propionate family kinase [Ferruginibacter sp.]